MLQIKWAIKCKVEEPQSKSTLNLLRMEHLSQLDSVAGISQIQCFEPNSKSVPFEGDIVREKLEGVARVCSRVAWGVPGC